MKCVSWEGAWAGELLALLAGPAGRPGHGRAAHEKVHGGERSAAQDGSAPGRTRARPSLAAQRAWAQARTLCALASTAATAEGESVSWKLRASGFQPTQRCWNSCSGPTGADGGVG